MGVVGRADVDAVDVIALDEAGRVCDEAQAFARGEAMLRIQLGIDDEADPPFEIWETALWV